MESVVRWNWIREIQMGFSASNSQSSDGGKVVRTGSRTDEESGASGRQWMTETNSVNTCRPNDGPRRVEARMLVRLAPGSLDSKALGPRSMRPKAQRPK